MSAVLYLETNYLMGVATGRYDAHGLLQRCPPGLVLALPAACVMEAFAAVEYEQAKARRLTRRLDRQIHYVRNAGRSATHSEVVSQLQATIPLVIKFAAELRERLGSALHILTPRLEYLSHAPHLVESSILDDEFGPADVLIALTIVDDARRRTDGARRLFTEDAHFRHMATDTLRPANIGLLRSPRSLDAWLASPEASS